MLNDERSRIASFLKDRGYYNFSINNIEYVADSTAGDRTIDLTMVVKPYMAGYTPEGEPIACTACAISLSFRDTTRRRR